MKTLLPKLLLILITVTVLVFPTQILAVDPSPVPSAAPAVSAAPADQNTIQAVQGDGSGAGWQKDAEVTYTGQLAVRSQEVLDWLIKNYQWSVIDQTKGNPFIPVYQTIQGVVFGLLALVILIAAFLMIITRGRSLTVKRFALRFVFVAAFIFLSYAVVSNLYWLTDGIQGMFIRMAFPDPADPNKKITREIQTTELLSVAFEYKDFKGYRRIDNEGTYNESAVTSLLLVKITAATYYTMFIILIIRKIILWFFILVSPVFPLLLFFKPIRNTAKIWVGEFFRWLLYAPLFAIFLRGLVEMWQRYIPLNFDVSKAGDPNQIIYPTSINILLGGPGQTVNGASNINYADTFVLYIVALLMLWMVIIMPWILLRIFLDYMFSLGGGDNNLMKFLARNNSPLNPFGGRYRSPEGAPPGSPGTPPPSGVAGLAKSLPMSKFRHTPVAEVQTALQESSAQAQQQIDQAISQNTQASNQIVNQVSQGISQSANQTATQTQQSMGQMFGDRSFSVPNLEVQQLNAEVLQLSGLSIPTMKDIAKYETAMLTQQPSIAKEEVSKLNEVLNRLAGSSPLTSPGEKEKFTAVRERLVTASNKGSNVAKGIVAAAAPVTGSALPESNEVQQVNLDDYEEVKNTWMENYRKIDPPAGPDGAPLDRKVWLKEEIQKIPQVIDLLLSGDPAKVEQGKQMVSKILPFLLLGGFSKAEVVAYLKAKLEAAKAVLAETVQKDVEKEDQDNLVDRATNKTQQNTMTLEAAVPEGVPGENSAIKPVDISNQEKDAAEKTNDESKKDVVI